MIQANLIFINTDFLSLRGQTKLNVLNEQIQIRNFREWLHP